jgi:hypothetical protein
LATAAPIVAAAGTISTGLLVVLNNAKSALSPAQKKEFESNAEAEIPSPNAPTESGASESPDKGTKQESPVSTNVSPLLLLGGGALLIFILTKKK